MTVTLLGYLVLAAAAIALEVAARRPDSRVPTVGACLTYVMRPPSARIGVMLAWLWVGWHFLAR